MDIFQSTKVATAIYDFSWQEVSPESRKILVLMMANAQKGVKLEVPFFQTSLATFIGVRKLILLEVKI